MTQVVAHHHRRARISHEIAPVYGSYVDLLGASWYRCPWTTAAPAAPTHA